MQQNGVWNYNGVIRAYNKTFDANPSSHRRYIRRKQPLYYLPSTENHIQLPFLVISQKNIVVRDNNICSPLYFKGAKFPDEYSIFPSRHL
ncbi:lipid II-degrading bacteriocin [Serratia sp. L9]|uniref:lipid II-degrading bacteriocin n=1 Tax=Serratia sp. L9 TaxID=3423946 RepID=UPI003D674D1E